MADISGQGTPPRPQSPSRSRGKLGAPTAMSDSCDLGSHVTAAGLKEVHMSVDQTGSNPPAGDVFDERVRRNGRRCARIDRFDSIAAQDDHAIADRRSAAAVDDRGTYERNARLCERRRRQYEGNYE